MFRNRCLRHAIAALFDIRKKCTMCLQGITQMCWESIYWWSTLVTAGDGYLPKGLHTLSPCPFIMYIYVQTDQWNTQRFHPCHLSLICVSYFTFEYYYSKQPGQAALAGGRTPKFTCLTTRAAFVHALGIAKMHKHAKRSVVRNRANIPMMSLILCIAEITIFKEKFRWLTQCWVCVNDLRLCV